MASVTSGTRGASKGGPIEGLYTQYQESRQAPLDRARECAAYTIPSLMPPEGNTDSADLRQTYQSVGARGVNNLAAKLLVSLLPPNTPFFRLLVDEFTKEEIRALEEYVEAQAEAQGLEAPPSDSVGDIESQLAQIERTVMKFIEGSNLRVQLFEALKQLVVSGNVVLKIDLEASKIKARVYRLDSYVSKRDPSGNLLELITTEKVNPAALPDEVKAACDVDPDGGPKGLHEYCTVFTQVKLISKGKYSVKQELNGHTVPNSEGTYSSEKLPWLALRWTAVPNQDYGESHCYQYLGDLRAADGLQRSVLEISSAMSKLLVMVKPNAITKPRAIAKAKSGAVITGNQEDVAFLQSQKVHEFGAIRSEIQAVESRLAFAFLMHDAIQRDAERVTAEEIRFMAEQLNTALGGTFSVLAQELQLPLTLRLLDGIPKLPKIPKDIITPAIVTGVEALGRGQDLAKLDTFLMGLGQALGPEAVAKYIDPTEYLRRRADALGITDSKSLVKSAEQIAMEEQQAQQMSMMQSMGPEALKQIGGAAQAQQQEEPQ